MEPTWIWPFLDQVNRDRPDSIRDSLISPLKNPLQLIKIISSIEMAIKQALSDRTKLLPPLPVL